MTADIVLLNDARERAVLVRGNQYATAIDIPTNSRTVAEMLKASKELANRGLRMAILTSEPEDGELPLDGMDGVRLVRADRKPEMQTFWDTVPANLLRRPEVPVHLVRDSKVIYDDAGRAFHVESCGGARRSLAVRIEPENVLVVCDDLSPDMPIRVEPGAVLQTLLRLEDWRTNTPEVIVPASGIPLAGDQLVETLDRNIRYLRSLHERLETDVLKAGWPWERQIYTIPCRAHWPVQRMEQPLYERHQQNIRHIVEDICVRIQQAAETTLVAA